MRILYSWLKEYVDVKAPAEKLAELLTMSGLSIESFKKTGDDYILELEVTSNRPDCLSVIGVAREVAAITGKKLKIPIAKGNKVTKLQGYGSASSPSLEPSRAQSRDKVNIKVEDKKLCPRYTARVIRNVKVGESPAWLKARIEAMGLRPVNNIVDITNFCLFETGEPMHAFDLDKISGGEVIVRKAKAGEKIITIENVGKILDGSDLVIADKNRAITIAGVMGGLDTEVNYSTKNILLEAAYFDPVSIRRTSRRLGISTESSYRFERRVDLENIIYSSDRAAAMIKELAGGEVGELYDIGKKTENLNEVTVRYARLNKISGVEIPPAKVKGILNSLGLKSKQASKDKVKLNIPSFRYDLQNEIDIIEEVARIYGYDKIPQTIPQIVEQPVRETSDMIAARKIRRVLVGLGLNEIITYSLLSKRLVSISAGSNKNIVDIANPLSAEQEAMRMSLIAGMLNSILWNINRKTKDLKLFELGNVYTKEANGKFEERKNLSIGITGQAYSDWVNGSRPSNIFDLKGIIETLLSELGIDGFHVKEAGDERFLKGTCASIAIAGTTAGVFGEVAPKILSEFDIKYPVYAAELDIGSIFKYISLKKTFAQLPKYPSVFRDISIIAAKDVTNDRIISSAKETAGNVLKDIKLIDRYAGKQVPDDKVSLTYRLEYQDLKKTLEDKDILDVHTRILHSLEEKLGARLR